MARSDEMREDRFRIGQLVRDVGDYPYRFELPLRIECMYVQEETVDGIVSAGELVAHCYPDGFPGEQCRRWPLRNLEPID